MDSRVGEPEITGDDLLTYYNALLTSFGNRGWWPAEGWFETIIGAVLAQNVSWTGASQAVQSLKEAGLLDPDQIMITSKEKIQLMEKMVIIICGVLVMLLTCEMGTELILKWTLTKSSVVNGVAAGQVMIKTEDN